MCWVFLVNLLEHAGGEGGVPMEGFRAVPLSSVVKRSEVDSVGFLRNEVEVSSKYGECSVGGDMVCEMVVVRCIRAVRSESGGGSGSMLMS